MHVSFRVLLYEVGPRVGLTSEVREGKHGEGRQVEGGQGEGRQEGGRQGEGRQGEGGEREGRRWRKVEVEEGKE